jgi:hypothetical protein
MNFFIFMDFAILNKEIYLTMIEKMMVLINVGIQSDVVIINVREVFSIWFCIFNLRKF